MPHNPQSRREASAVPLVLFGEHGRTVEGYRPADEDLAGATAGRHAHVWGAVQGPHLLACRTRDKRSQTGLVGISVSRCRRTGRHFLVVNLGSTNRKFCVETLGRTEAWRRAVALRRDHVRKLAAANAVILRARAAHRPISR